MNHYNHLTIDERENARVLLEQAFSLRAIARKLKRSASSISREIKRNSLKSGKYTAYHAQKLYDKRKRNCGAKPRLSDENIKTYVIPTHSMWINSISYEIVDAPGTRVILDEIIGDEYEYTPNIIDDGGAGRYQAGGDAQPEGDDTPPDLDNGDNSGSVDEGSDANNNGGNTDEGNSGDNSGSQTGGVEDIPEPGE